MSVALMCNSTPDQQSTYGYCTVPLTLIQATNTQTAGDLTLACPLVNDERLHSFRTLHILGATDSVAKIDSLLSFPINFARHLLLLRLRIIKHQFPPTRRPKCKASLFCLRLDSPSGPRPLHSWYFEITLRHTTIGRTPSEDGSDRRRDLHLTTHNIHRRQTSTPPAGFQSVIPSRRAVADPLIMTARPLRSPPTLISFQNNQKKKIPILF